jgi:SAM-dependent methyltransferase
MTTKSRESESGATGQLFWEHRAPGYTLPFEAKTFSRTSRIIDFIAAEGIPVAGARLLDIGCGTGAFALPFAQRGASVTALDISENMLKRLAAEAERLRLDLVTPMRISWKGIDVGEAGLEGAFDVVVSAFSAAVNTEEDIRAMERCSTKWCVSIASGRIRRTALCEKILRACGAPRDANPDTRKIRRKLTKMGRTFLFRSFTEAVKEERSPKQIAEQVANRLEAAGKRLDRDAVFATVFDLCAPPGGELKTVECHGSLDIGVLMWRVDGKV